MVTWFTSDTHFGHDAIIGNCKRPFANALEMDAALIHGWNAVVAPGDAVYHLGDFCYRASRSAVAYRQKLNGKIHLIAGNHDTGTVKDHADLFASVSQIKELTIEGQMLVLCHYPMREWPGFWRGAWHLFGHMHGRMDGETIGRSLDVGVDSHHFRPIGMDRLRVLLGGRVDAVSGGD